MSSNIRVRCVATAAVVTLVTAAAACASKGSTTGADIDLQTESAAQAVLAGQRAGGAEHTVQNHMTTIERDFSVTMDGIQRTDAFEADLTSATTTNAIHSTVHGEIRMEGATAYMNDPGLPANFRHGKTWVAMDLAHPQSANSTDPAATLFATLGDTYRHLDSRQASAFTVAFSDLHRVGVETKDGRQALHIAGTLTPATLPAAPEHRRGRTAKRDSAPLRPPGTVEP